MEGANIGFLFMKYPSHTDNKSPYPMYIYTDVPHNISPNNKLQQQQLTGRNTYGLLRRVALIGSAPPQAAHAKSVSRNGGRYILGVEWTSAAQRSVKMRFLLELLINDDPELLAYVPTFFDHHPDLVSDKHNTSPQV